MRADRVEGRQSVVKPTKFDVLLVASLLVVVVAFVGFSHVSRARADADRPLVAVISINGAEYMRLPMYEDTTVTLPTTHVVQVKGGEVSVSSAPCPDRVCVHTTPASAVGNCIVCSPERLVITIAEDMAT